MGSASSLKNTSCEDDSRIHVCEVQSSVERCLPNELPFSDHTIALEGTSRVLGSSAPPSPMTHAVTRAATAVLPAPMKGSRTRSSGYV